MTMAQALKQVDKEVANAVKAGLVAEKRWQQRKQLEAKLKEAHQRESDAYRKASELIGALDDKGLSWAVYQIQEALQEGMTVEEYLAELREQNPISYLELVGK